MQEIKPTWEMAYRIMRRHTFVSGCITLTIIVLATLILSLVLHLRGEAVSIAVLREFFMKYRPFITWSLVHIHLFPVNMYASRRALQYKYRGFRVVVYATAESEVKVGMDNVSSRYKPLANDIVDQV